MDEACRATGQEYLAASIGGARAALDEARAKSGSIADLAARHGAQAAVDVAGPDAPAAARCAAASAKLALAFASSNWNASIRETEASQKAKFLEILNGPAEVHAPAQSSAQSARERQRA